MYELFKGTDTFRKGQTPVPPRSTTVFGTSTTSGGDESVIDVAEQVDGRPCLICLLVYFHPRL